MLNFSLLVLSFKVFFLQFFRDLEFILTVWNFLFLWIVILIRSRVILFSFSYIRSLFVRKFTVLYISFVSSIIWLILRANFYWIILGWDGLGIVSFLLILFYINHERINNGLFTLFQNRLGDIFFVLFIVGIVSLNISRIFLLKWGLLFLVLGRVVKRAQFPFNSWLLAAISAPTPISSLVHSSTLVVAGVFILLQFRYCLIDQLHVLKYLRVLTLLISSFGLLNEIDIKKLIAYSTINHVALILFILRMQLYKIVYFHLNIHAMFKSLIFISFGFVMLASFHGQDKRLIRLAYLNPVLKVIYYFASLCLAGLPFLRGFFSKDFILEKIILWNTEIFWVFLLVLFLRLRIYYSLKLILLNYSRITLRIIEKNFLGGWRILAMRLIIVIIINIFLSLMLRLSLEVLSIKLFVYLGVFFFFFLSLITNFNYKYIVYEKSKNFLEIWSIPTNLLEKFIYWNIINLVELSVSISWYKIILIINWWRLIVLFVFFYKKSFKSVTLKELRIFYIFYGV